MSIKKIMMTCMACLYAVSLPLTCSLLAECGIKPVLIVNKISVTGRKIPQAGLLLEKIIWSFKSSGYYSQVMNRSLNQKQLKMDQESASSAFLVQPGVLCNGKKMDLNITISRMSDKDLLMTDTLKATNLELMMKAIPDFLQRIHFRFIFGNQSVSNAYKFQIDPRKGIFGGFLINQPLVKSFQQTGICEITPDPGDYYDSNIWHDQIYVSILNGTVVFLHTISPMYRFPEGLKVGDPEKKLIELLGEPFQVLDDGTDYDYRFSDYKFVAVIKNGKIDAFFFSAVN